MSRLRWLLGWVGCRLMGFGDRMEMVGDDLLVWSQERAER